MANGKDGEVRIIFRTEAELSGATALQASLERQIGAAKAAGKPFADLQQQHQRVSSAIDVHNEASKNQERVYQSVDRATEKATSRQKELREVLRGLSLQFPILGRVIGAVVHPLGALAGAVGITITALHHLLTEGNRVAAEFDVAHTLTKQTAGAEEAAETFARAASTFAASLGKIRSEAVPAAAAVEATLSALKKLQALQLEAEDKELAAATAVINEQESAGKIKPSQAITMRKGLADSARARRAKLVAEQDAEQKRVIQEGIEKAAADEAAARARLLPADALAKGQTAVNERAGLAADVQKEFEAKQPGLQRRIFDAQTRTVDISQEDRFRPWWGRMVNLFTPPAKRQEIAAQQAARVSASGNEAWNLQEELQLGQRRVDQTAAAARKAKADQDALLAQQQEAEAAVEAAAKTQRELRARLRGDTDMDASTAPIRQRISDAETKADESAFRTEYNRAKREEEEKAKREALRKAEEEKQQGIRDEKDRRDRERGNWQSSTGPDLSATADGLRQSAVNLSELPQAAAALSQATNQAITALWQAVADMNARGRDGLS